MNKNPYPWSKWKELIPDIDSVIREMEKTDVLSVGVTPYTRIIPAFFLNTYSIYTVQHSSDVDILQEYLRMHVLEDHHPAIAKKVHGTGYLVGNHVFQSFLRSWRRRPALVFNTINEKTIQTLEGLKVPWLGNAPKTFESVVYKGSFRELVRQYGLPSLPSETYALQDFLASSFDALWQKFEGPFVVQRGDKEVGGNDGTFFIHEKKQFEYCTALLSQETGFTTVVVTAFIEGDSTSVLGCVMPKGILTGPLQLQLIDIPQSLHGMKPGGCFFGNDMGYHPWDAEIESTAQKVVERIGEHLREKGYLGIFGIDFLYDKRRNKIFPNECNPRSPGSTTLYSLMLLEIGVPPLEFFHLMAHLGIESSYDFEKVNVSLKKRLPCAHIAFSPKDIPFMNLPLLAGLYSYNSSKSELSYKGAGISLHDLKDEKDFLVIDTVPTMKAPIEQNVPRLFKFIFKRSIAKSSYEIDKEAGYLLERFSLSLIEAAKENRE
ncbi:MAG: ATP-grasp domain-containing protein [Candidatus Pacebacteria bacterium]|nr:ATP-grasp domain-containing protein [Candidatus Paceibacterota bacterium]MDD5356881.1 ATP-grasp domain-containing protein [Candidatus Paceibacterota bacterium]